MIYALWHQWLPNIMILLDLVSAGPISIFFVFWKHWPYFLCMLAGLFFFRINKILTYFNDLGKKKLFSTISKSMKY